MVVAQAINLLAVPVLARLYTPVAFADFGVFVALSSIIAVAVTLRYDAVLQLPKADSEAKAVLAACLLLAACGGVVLAIASFAVPWGSDLLSDYSRLRPWALPAIAVGSAGACLNALYAQLNRDGHFKTIAVFRVIQASCVAVGAITLGLLGADPGLLAAQVIAFSLMAMLGWWQLAKLRLRFHRQSMASVMHCYKSAPKFLLPAALVDVLTQQLPMLLIIALFDADLAGQFNMAWRIMALPITLVGAAVGQVFYQRFSRLWPDVTSARRLVVQTWGSLLALGLIPSLVVVLFGRELFEFVLGPQWNSAGALAGLLAPMLLAMFVSSATSSAYIVLGMEKHSLFFSISFLIYRSASMLAGTYFNSIAVSILCWTACELTAILVYNFILMKKMRRYEVDRR